MASNRNKHSLNINMYMHMYMYNLHIERSERVGFVFILLFNWCLCLHMNCQLHFKQLNMHNLRLTRRSARLYIYLIFFLLLFFCCSSNSCDLFCTHTQLNMQSLKERESGRDIACVFVLPFAALTLLLLLLLLFVIPACWRSCEQERQQNMLAHSFWFACILLSCWVFAFTFLIGMYVSSVFLAAKQQKATISGIPASACSMCLYMYVILRYIISLFKNHQF